MGNGERRAEEAVGAVGRKLLERSFLPTPLFQELLRKYEKWP
jgi:hypothetical protein